MWRKGGLSDYRSILSFALILSDCFLLEFYKGAVKITFSRISMGRKKGL